jgi:outer membrane immunogenic protein
MKKVMLAVSGAVLLAIPHSNAADLGPRRPVYKAPPPAMVPAPVFTWTGCYIGGNIGWGWGRDTVSIPNIAETAGVPPEEVAGLTIPSVTGNTNGVLGGGQAGCNYQFASNWVIGIEGDGEAADIKGDVSESVPFANPFVPGSLVTITGTAHARTDWIASVTGRLGWAWDRVLLYAKGGAAWAGDKYSVNIPIFGENLSASETRSGWTVGGGVEWAFWNNWSAKVEYDFYDFGTRDISLSGTFTGGPTTFNPGPITVSGINIKETIQTVKFGINYRFGTY